MLVPRKFAIAAEIGAGVTTAGEPNLVSCSLLLFLADSSTALLEDLLELLLGPELLYIKFTRKEQTLILTRVLNVEFEFLGFS